MSANERIALQTGAARQAEANGHTLIKEESGYAKGKVKWLLLGDGVSSSAICGMCSRSVCVDGDGQVQGDALERQCPSSKPKEQICSTAFLLTSIVSRLGNAHGRLQSLGLSGLNLKKIYQEAMQELREKGVDEKTLAPVSNVLDKLSDLSEAFDRLGESLVHTCGKTQA